MAVPANTVLTFASTGEREDLSDAIFQISPMETPFTTGAAKLKAASQLHEWQTYDLAAAASNTHPEGDDSAADSRATTTRLNNRAQIMKKTVSTSGSQQAARMAGRGNEHSFQMAKAGQELKRDMEYNIVRSGSTTTGATNTAATLGQLENWLTTNKYHAAGGTTPGWASNNVGSVTDAATFTGAFSETALGDLLEDIWDQGGDPDVVMVGGQGKRTASTFSGIATQYRDNREIGAVAILGSADVYVSDWGELAIVPNRFQRAQTVFALDMEYWGIAFYRPFKREKLAKTGDSTKEHIVGELTLVSRNEKASGKLADRALGVTAN